MIIDGITIKPTKKYTFNENGNHTILFSFFPFNESTKNKSIGIFNGIENLLNVEFSFYHFDVPDVSLIKMFNNCINLISVDFSKLSLNDNLHPYNEHCEYFFIMDYTFNNCIKLEFVNFSISTPKCLLIHSTNFMFNNCISLTSIDLSVFCFYYGYFKDYKSGLNNMFSNCISLKDINVGSDYYSSDSSNPVNMSYMSYNCSSLTSIDLSSFESFHYFNDMSYAFAYCYQLKEIIFEFIYNFDLKYMSNAFRNCTSLVNVDLFLYTFFVEDMSYLFYGCISLTNISFISASSKNTHKYMNYMFYDCRSLKSISHLYFFNESQIFIRGSDLQDISYMFSGCSSLTSIDLSKFITRNVKNYEGLFYNCPKLEYIDISSFTHNNLPKSNLSIFNNNSPLKGTIYINKDFLNRIEIPSTLQIEDGTNNND